MKLSVLLADIICLPAFVWKFYIDLKTKKAMLRFRSYYKDKSPIIYCIIIVMEAIFVIVGILYLYPLLRGERIQGL